MFEQQSIKITDATFQNSLEITNWYFRQVSDTSNEASGIVDKYWHKAKPGTNGQQVHLDLLHNKLIPDPFIDDNEKIVQWVGQADWEYGADFTVDGVNDCKSYYLVFDGLDTFASIYLNDKLILESDNSFRKYKIDVLEEIRSTNKLRIVFKSSLREGRLLEKKFGHLDCWNGESSRVYVRKPQYHYGWDWGPLLLTCGPWRPVTLHCGPYVEDFFVQYSLNEALTQAELTFGVDLVLPKEEESSTMQISIIGPDGLVDTIETSVVKASTTIHYALKNIKLWFPAGHGDQNLYTFKLHLCERVVDETKTGFRKIELIQDSDKIGRSFYFKINNIPIFMKGSCWIPAHSFISDLTTKDYEDWIQLAISGNQNMLRVWGGGIYETDDFYRICDEKGVLVWQDFMFGCAVYPAHNEFVDNVRQEVIDQLKRLRKYACIAIYAGNNEDYQVLEVLQDQDPSYTKFPARVIYEEVLPKLVADLTAQTAYRFGSPYSDTGIHTADLTIGDIHQWNVWHGTQEPYQDWGKLAGRFVSEFGMLALPDYSTLDQAITRKEQLFPQSYLMDHHNKSTGFERRLALYVMENFALPVNFNLKTWVYITQVMQSDCLSLAYRYWIRKWKDFACGGALVWQLNDCWPVTSWSIADFNHAPKLAYYGIKRECAATGIACYRVKERIGDPHEPENLAEQTPLHDYVAKYSYSLDVWCFSDDELHNLSASISLYDKTGKLLETQEKVDITLAKNSVTDVLTSFTSPNLDGNCIIELLLLNEEGEVMHRSSDWPSPLKYLDWKVLNEGLKLSYEEIDNKTIRVSTNRPVKSLRISLETKESYHLCDNGFDLFPGDPRIITVEHTDQKLAPVNFEHIV
ncbi:family 2 glycoside hydrolase [Scheffersomyces xylosifermentans]|uniref:family 2 glycoside hydrolase n=1 Tax=Scheffersomyces xylosifermentans TaxID=1304137 RepID=UPI00315D32D3